MKLKLPSASDITLQLFIQSSNCYRCNERWARLLEEHDWQQMTRCQCEQCDCQIMAEEKDEINICVYCKQGNHSEIRKCF